jgi:hypothetical protein
METHPGSYHSHRAQVATSYDLFQSRAQEWRMFGADFPLMKTGNSIVSVEAYHSSVLEPGVKLIKFSFGKNLDAQEMRFGYVIKCSTDSGSPDSAELEWQYGGERCAGIYNGATRTAVLNFFLRNSTVTITYRILDADSMAVSIVEVDDENTPTIQYGHMCVLSFHYHFFSISLSLIRFVMFRLRIDESLYQQPAK